LGQGVAIGLKDEPRVLGKNDELRANLSAPRDLTRVHNLVSKREAGAGVDRLDDTIDLLLHRWMLRLSQETE
jgi:hypothetical protein